MKRDMELIRSILSLVEDDDRLFQVSTGLVIQVDGHPKAKVDYHVRLLADGGYLMGIVSAPNSVPLVQGLTWKGHDFVNTMRTKEVWDRVLIAVKKVGTMALDAVLDLGKDIAKDQARKHLGL